MHEDEKSLEDGGAEPIRQLDEVAADDKMNVIQKTEDEWRREELMEAEINQKDAVKQLAESSSKNYPQVKLPKNVFDADAESSAEPETTEEQKKDKKVVKEEDIWSYLSSRTQFSVFEDFADYHEIDVQDMKDVYSMFSKFGDLNFKKMI